MRMFDPPGVVMDSDVEVLRRIIYAFGGDGNISITRHEAEMLFMINDATVGAENAESWQDLFVKTIANCVLTASGYMAPSREQALAREAWLDRRGDLSPGNMLGGMLSAYRSLGKEELAIGRLERHKIEIITGEPVHFADPARLAGRLMSAELHDGPARRAIDALAAGGLTLVPALMQGRSGAYYAA